MNEQTNAIADSSTITVAPAGEQLEELGHTVGLDEMSIRGAMSEFTTGVTIVATEHEGEKVGFACQSFSSLSLDPPMILFTVMKSSRSWPHIEKTGTFAVNVLAEDQEDISAEFGRRNGKKFDSGQWSRSELGNPLLHGSSVWIDCTVADVHEGGDHWIVTANIVAIGQRDEVKPLIYHRGSYARVLRPGIDASVEEKWRQRPSV
ncbi:flavin reductase family protein [Corynebacterium lactis]|uniref:Monooxygenase n=1 Tax=Corynebacterium lactis RW2-5 TaxID=1408189 RepID=A0A0K2H1X7_9CORY|nr:flavin reductase family protein [Corynebacterium lactis]ALA68050.1 monooxygenase [Corynebacterium lactis RW2-5]